MPVSTHDHSASDDRTELVIGVPGYIFPVTEKM